jgi:hypothetical protein
MARTSYFQWDDDLFHREISATDNIGKAIVTIDKAIDTVGNVITRTDSTWRINTDVCVYKEDFVLAHLDTALYMIVNLSDNLAVFIEAQSLITLSSKQSIEICRNYWSWWPARHL